MAHKFSDEYLDKVLSQVELFSPLPRERFCDGACTSLNNWVRWVNDFIEHHDLGDQDEYAVGVTQRVIGMLPSAGLMYALEVRYREVSKNDTFETAGCIAPD